MGKQAKVRFHICVRDSAGKSLAEPTTIEVLSGAGETTARRICFSLDLNGTYVLDWRAETGQLSFEGESHFAVVPPEDRELAATSPFGLRRTSRISRVLIPPKNGEGEIRTNSNRPSFQTAIFTAKNSQFQGLRFPRKLTVFARFFTVVYSVLRAT